MEVIARFNYIRDDHRCCDVRLLVVKMGNHDLAAASMATLRRYSRLARILLRTEIEFLFALGAAEVVGLPFELGFSRGGGGFNIHAAHRILYSSYARHYDFS